VQATPSEGSAVTGKLVGRGSAVDLGKLAGKPARLELTASGCPSARLAGAALVVPGPAPVFKRGAAPKHVVLWVMDSLRADRVRTIIGEAARPEVPVMDELAQSSAVFTQAYVQGNETKCSHASMWTSLYPVNHKMIPPNERIDPKWVTVEEVAKSAGMTTSGESANGYITPKRGFGEKWDRFRNHIHEGGGLRAEDVLTKGIESITEPTSPWLLYLGTIDTHVSWRAKEPWFSTYDPEPYSGRFKDEASGVDMGKVASGSLKISDRDKKRIIAIYDSNVSYQDQQVGVLLAKLKEWGVAGDTMLVIIADHGDEQFEAGRVGHGGSILDTLVHVPLFIHYPPMVPAGKVAEGAEVVDIVPTIADALGVKPDDNWQGESLLPLVNGVGGGYPRMSMASHYENAHAGRMGPWKAFYAAGKGKLFDVVKEPDETHDIQKDNPIAMRMVSDALWLLRTYNAEWKKSRWGNPANVTAAFAADMGE
jgi:arylsulfatase